MEKHQSVSIRVLAGTSALHVYSTSLSLLGMANFQLDLLIWLGPWDNLMDSVFAAIIVIVLCKVFFDFFAS